MGDDGWKVVVIYGWKATIIYGWKVAIAHLEIYAKLISSQWMHLYTPTIFWLMKSSTHPSSRSFTKDKEEIVQSDLQSLPNRIECDHMDDILWNSSKFLKTLKEELVKSSHYKSESALLCVKSTWSLMSFPFKIINLGVHLRVFRSGYQHEILLGRCVVWKPWTCESRCPN
jgi:hypothetical protein